MEVIYELTDAAKLYGPISDFAMAKPHTLQTVVVEMRNACRDLEDEIADMDDEAEMVLADLTHTVTALDQLRYKQGGIDEQDPKKQLVDGVLTDLKKLEDVCNGKN